MARFTDEEWTSVLSILAKVIGPDAKRYDQDPGARLMAAIPFLAGSEDPDRFAVSNLLTFHAFAKAPELFDHRAADDEDVFRRLATFHVGNHAEPRVVDYGLTLLALMTLSNHERDADKDRSTGRYNPLNTKKWDADTVRKELLADLAKFPAAGSQFEGVVALGPLIGSPRPAF